MTRLPSVNGCACACACVFDGHATCDYHSFFQITPKGVQLLTDATFHSGGVLDETRTVTLLEPVDGMRDSGVATSERLRLNMK